MRQTQGGLSGLMLIGRLTLEPGTCYVVIAMRNMFVKGELPGETPSRSAGSDISSFAELYQNALDVYAKCGKPEVNKPGWYPAGRPPHIISAQSCLLNVSRRFYRLRSPGDLNSIGVFLWQSVSEINERIHIALPTSPNLASTAGYGSIGDLFGDTA